MARYEEHVKKLDNRINLTGKTNGWKAVLNTLTVHYGDRIADHIR